MTLQSSCSRLAMSRSFRYTGHWSCIRGKVMDRHLLTVCLALFLLMIMMSISNAQSQVLVEQFEERTFRYTGGRYKDAEIKYRLHVPKNVRYGRKYPLIIHLHGVGEAGSDNTHSLLYLDSILHLMTGPQREDFFLLVLQCSQAD